jgi:hypothetical protein
MLHRLYIPFHLLILIPLLALALPLSILALLTTTLALLALFARLIIVYLDLALALLTSWIPPLLTSPTAASRNERRGRASTATSPRPPASAPAVATAAPPLRTATPSPRLSRRTSRSDSHVSVVLGLGTAPDRDYEGVGGWRLVDDGGAGLADADAGGDCSDYGDDLGAGDGDEATWAGWNSRLELPASGGVPRRPRSLTGSSATAVMVPQDKTRRSATAARVASVEHEDDGGYFAQAHGLRPTSGIVMTSLDDDEVNHHDFSKP